MVEVFGYGVDVFGALIFGWWGGGGGVGAFAVCGRGGWGGGGGLGRFVFGIWGGGGGGGGGGVLLCGLLVFPLNREHRLSLYISLQTRLVQGAVAHQKKLSCCSTGRGTCDPIKHTQCIILIRLKQPSGQLKLNHTSLCTSELDIKSSICRIPAAWLLHDHVLVHSSETGSEQQWLLAASFFPQLTLEKPLLGPPVERLEYGYPFFL